MAIQQIAPNWTAPLVGVGYRPKMPFSLLKFPNNLCSNQMTAVEIHKRYRNCYKLRYMAVDGMTTNRSMVCLAKSIDWFEAITFNSTRKYFLILLKGFPFFPLPFILSPHSASHLLLGTNFKPSTLYACVDVCVGEFIYFYFIWLNIRRRRKKKG